MHGAIFNGLHIREFSFPVLSYGSQTFSKASLAATLEHFKQYLHFLKRNPEYRRKLQCVFKHKKAQINQYGYFMEKLRQVFKGNTASSVKWKTSDERPSAHASKHSYFLALSHELLTSSESLLAASIAYIFWDTLYFDRERWQFSWLYRLGAWCLWHVF